MSYRIAIKNNSTGEVRVYESDDEWRGENDPEMLQMGISESPSAFWWTEGNGGCDCNRELHFEYANAPRERHAEIHAEKRDSLKCGDDRFAIEYVELPDGKRFTL